MQRLDHMLPSLFQDDFAYAPSGNSEGGREIQLSNFSSGVHASYGQDISGTKTVKPETFRGHKPSFLNTILNVVSWRSCKEMIRITAGRIIAFVANHYPIRNVMLKLPSLPMSEFSPLMIRPWGKDSVPEVVFRTKKWPALIRLSALNLFPKSIRKWCELYFSPSSESTPELNRNSREFCMWVFEFHNVGLCRNAMEVSNF